jgi:hypothetical protein
MTKELVLSYQTPDHLVCYATTIIDVRGIDALEHYKDIALIHRESLAKEKVI